MRGAVVVAVLVSVVHAAPSFVLPRLCINITVPKAV